MILVGKVGRVYVAETGEVFATVLIPETGEVFNDARILSSGGGGAQAFQHNPLTAFGEDEGAADSVFNSADVLVVVLGQGRFDVMARAYVIGTINGDASRAFLSSQDTQVSSDGVGSRAIGARDQAAFVGGGRWVLREDGTVELSTVESGKNVVVNLASGASLQIVQVTRKEDGTTQAVSVPDESVLKAGAVRSWWNDEVRPILLALQGSLNTLAGASQSATAAGVAAGGPTNPAFAAAYIGALSQGLSSLSGSLDAVPVAGEDLVSGLIVFSNEEDEE